MEIKFKFIDKIIILISLVVIAVCWAFLSDLNYLHDIKNNGEKIGQITIKGQDVRKKVSSEYFWQNIKGQNNIYNGDSFYAGKNSSAIVDLDDGSTLQIKENSSVKFNNKQSKLSIDIVFGQVKVNAKSKFITVNDCNKDVHIESLGASFDIDKGRECGDMQIKVKKGRIKMANQLVDADTRMALNAVNNSPSLEKVFKFMDRPQNVKAHIQMAGSGELEFVASWDSVTKASEYELEISSDPTMNSDKKNYHVKENNIILRKIGAERLYYRLRANASESSLGEFSDVDVAVVKESLDAPQLQATELSVLSHNELALSLNWLPAAKASQYQVEISQTADFTKTSVQVVKGFSTKFSGLDQTAVYVRVRAENNFAKSEFSRPVFVTLNKERMSSPQILTADLKMSGQNELALNIDWLPLDKISQYQVEISETPDFIKPIVQVVSVPGVKFSGLKQAALYARVRAENKFIKSDFSEPILVTFKYDAHDNSNKILSSECTVLNDKEVGSKKDFIVNWQPVPLAQEYTVKVIDNKKSSQVSRMQTRNPASTVTVPACGEYDVQVAAYDKGGRKISSEFKASKIIYKKTIKLLDPVVSEKQKNIDVFFQLEEDGK